MGRLKHIVTTQEPPNLISPIEVWRVMGLDERTKRTARKRLRAIGVIDAASGLITRTALQELAPDVWVELGRSWREAYWRTHEADS
jgi:hypothetical protein